MIPWLFIGTRFLYGGIAFFPSTTSRVDGVVGRPIAARNAAAASVGVKCVGLVRIDPARGHSTADPGEDGSVAAGLAGLVLPRGVDRGIREVARALHLAAVVRADTLA